MLVGIFIFWRTYSGSLGQVLLTNIHHRFIFIMWGSNCINIFSNIFSVCFLATTISLASATYSNKSRSVTGLDSYLFEYFAIMYIFSIWTAVWNKTEVVADCCSLKTFWGLLLIEGAETVHILPPGAPVHILPPEKLSAGEFISWVG